ncbi:hypothetical protein [Serratia liquefaciens]|uniref:hypothetical protein n=1 Tax=Serratia liquefaciens TaxID=614 RepID=UPI001F181C1B|nr:hypothetical protein [Serratia liquefaciens]MCE9939941.1 hypothetical protein [Serratia liquefaciens]
MTSFLSVSGCQHLDEGAKRVYHLTNKTSVIEYPRLPARSRFQFYDARGNKVHTNAERVVMKQAVERHKKQWRFE